MEAKLNIFVLDKDPIKAAKMQNNRHVVKMILETSQLLSNAMWHYNRRGPLQETHRNHPSSIWARESKGNFRWLLNHLKALMAEYTYRYNKVHLYELNGVYNILEKFYNEFDGFEKDSMTDFPQCMPDQYKVNRNPVQAYRNYYMGAKRHLAQWKKTSKPEWYQ